MSNLDNLEAEKLQLEINALKKPWWQRPAYAAVALPTLLAAGSLVAALWTGVFDAKSERLKTEVMVLEIKKDKLTKQEIDLAERTDQLKKREADLTTSVDRLEDQVQTLRAQLTQAGYLVPLNALAAFGDKVSPLNDNTDILIQQLKQIDDRAPMITAIEKVIASSPSTFVQSNLLRILFLGTGNKTYMARLFELSQEPENYRKFRFWSVFTSKSHTWPDDHLPALGNLALGLLAKLRSSENSYVISGILKTFYAFRHRTNKLSALETGPSRDKAVAIAIWLASSKDVTWTSRISALEALALLDPEIMLPISARIVLREQDSYEILSRLDDYLNSAKKIGGRRPWMKAFPLNVDVNEWQKWETAYPDAVNALNQRMIEANKR